MNDLKTGDPIGYLILPQRDPSHERMFNGEDDEYIDKITYIELDGGMGPISAAKVWWRKGNTEIIPLHMCEIVGFWGKKKDGT